MGRPSKLNAETTQALADALALGTSILTACKAAGIGETTFSAWFKRGRSKAPADAEFRRFRRAILKARASGEVHALQVIKSAMPNSWQAAAWFIERSRPMRWGRADRLKAVEARNRTEAGIIDVKACTDEQLQALINGKKDLTGIPLVHSSRGAFPDSKGFSEG